MTSSRLTFLKLSIGAGSAVTFAGCASAVRSVIPTEAQGSAYSSSSLEAQLIPPGSIAVEYVRQSGAFKSITHLLRHFKQEATVGSKIYFSGAYVIEHGSDYTILPSSAKLSKDRDHVYAVNIETGTTFAFPGNSSIRHIGDSYATLVRPGESLEPDLDAGLLVGTTMLAHTVTTEDIVKYKRTGLTKDITPVRGPVGDDDDDDDDDDFGGDITSSHNECEGNGENIGISYVVPCGEPGNVTITQCINNGKTNVCHPFTNQVPCSSHNVSVYIPGTGSVGISMGLIYGNDPPEDGIGSSSLPGC